jgi:RNA polymerase sigma-70 factor (ECF subfamily)
MGVTLNLVPRSPDNPSDPGKENGEAELLARCRAGEREAFDRIYRDNRRIVAATLYRVLGDRGELDDLVQEVFVIAFRGLARFRGDSKISTWLYRICVNVALGKLRSRSRRPPALPMAVPRESTPEESPDTPERLLERRDDVARVYRALDQLAPKKRVVLVLHEIEGLDLKEIAEIVKAPQVTVRTRLHYARKEFYALLGKPEGGGS